MITYFLPKQPLSTENTPCQESGVIKEKFVESALLKVKDTKRISLACRTTRGFSVFNKLTLSHFNVNVAFDQFQNHTASFYTLTFIYLIGLIVTTLANGISNSISNREFEESSLWYV